MGLRDLTRRLLGKTGSDLVWIAAQRLAYPPDFSPEDVALCQAVAGKTMSTPEQIVALASAIQLLTANGIEGAIVECGVWRGGSMMAAALTLLECGERTRELFLFDTFEGMTRAGTQETSVLGRSAARTVPEGAYKATEIEVMRNLESTRYPLDSVRLVRGRVEDTVPERAPSRIALLRLDTDWYDSIRHELTHLYPRLSPGGVLIIDDYGHWTGTRKAADEFLAALSPRPFLCRVDYSARCFIKP